MSSERLLAERRILLFGPPDLDSVARYLRDVGADAQRFELSATSSTRSLESWIAELMEGAFDDVLFLTGQGALSPRMGRNGAGPMPRGTSCDRPRGQDARLAQAHAAPAPTSSGGRVTTTSL